MLVKGFTVIEGQMKMIQLNRYLENGNKIMNNALYLCIKYNLGPEIYSQNALESMFWFRIHLIKLYKFSCYVMLKDAHLTEFPETLHPFPS